MTAGWAPGAWKKANAPGRTNKWARLAASLASAPGEQQNTGTGPRSSKGQGQNNATRCGFLEKELHHTPKNQTQVKKKSNLIQNDITTALTKLTVVARLSLRNLSGHSTHQTEPPRPDITTTTSLLPSALKSGVEVWKTRSQSPALGTATTPPHDPSSRTRTDELGEAPNRQAAGPRHELQQPDPLLIVHLLHHL